jgi:hypothetical protein
MSRRAVKCAAQETCNTFVAAFCTVAENSLPLPNVVQLGAMISEPHTPVQAAHYDQAEENENGRGSEKWQAIVTGTNKASLLVYPVTSDGVLWEVEVVIPPYHLCAFQGRLLHAGAANETDSVMSRGFMYFHGWDDGFANDFMKPTHGPGEWDFEDLCWQQGLDHRACTKKRGALIRDQVRVRVRLFD